MGKVNKKQPIFIFLGNINMEKRNQGFWNISAMSMKDNFWMESLAEREPLPQNKESTLGVLGMGIRRDMGSSNGQMDHFIVETTIKVQEKVMDNTSITKTQAFLKECGETVNSTDKVPTSNQEEKAIK